MSRRKLNYSISAITRLRRQLSDEVFFEHLGETLDADGLQRLLQQLQRRLGRAQPRALEDSVRFLMFERLTTTVAHELSWRLAGNYHRLQRGIAATPWLAQDSKEWVPVHILSFQPSHDRNNQLAATYLLQIMAGSPCPRQIRKQVSCKFAYRMGRLLGYTARNRKHPMSDLSELVNLRFLALLDPALSRYGQPGFDKLDCSGSLKAWNKSVISRRFRMLDGAPWPCPRGYRWRCYQCHVGYDQCPAGTHRRTESAGPEQGVADGLPVQTEVG